MCFPNGGGGFGGPRTVSLLGWLLAFLAAASLGVGIANTAYTYIKYNKWVGSTCPNGSIINMCVVIFTYISSGIWASVPIFFTGIIAVRMSVTYNLMRMFQILIIVCTVVFAPAMIIISVIEAIAWNNTSPFAYLVTSSAITGEVTKFALPVTVAVLAAVEFIILLFLMCYVLRSGNLLGVGLAAPVATTLIGGGYVGGAVPYGGYGGYGGGEVVLADAGGDDLLGGGDAGLGLFDYGPPPPAPPQFIPIGGGGPGGAGGGGSAAGGGAAGGSAAASSGGGSGSGGASNNNNNNIVVPPVIIPPSQPAAPSFMPFPIFMPGNNAPAPAPIIITTTTNGGQAAPPPPQPVFVPLPTRRTIPLPPPPVPPSRYFPRY